MSGVDDNSSAAQTAALNFLKWAQERNVGQHVSSPLTGLESPSAKQAVSASLSSHFSAASPSARRKDVFQYNRGESSEKQIILKQYNLIDSSIQTTANPMIRREQRIDAILSTVQDLADNCPDSLPGLIALVRALDSSVDRYPPTILRKKLFDFAESMQTPPSLSQKQPPIAQTQASNRFPRELPEYVSSSSHTSVTKKLSRPPPLSVSALVKGSQGASTYSFGARGSHAAKEVADGPHTTQQYHVRSRSFGSNNRRRRTLSGTFRTHSSLSSKTLESSYTKNDFIDNLMLTSPNIMQTNRDNATVRQPSYTESDHPTYEPHINTINSALSPRSYFPSTAPLSDSSALKFMAASPPEAIGEPVSDHEPDKHQLNKSTHRKQESRHKKSHDMSSSERDDDTKMRSVDNADYDEILSISIDDTETASDSSTARLHYDTVNNVASHQYKQHTTDVVGCDDYAQDVSDATTITTVTTENDDSPTESVNPIIPFQVDNEHDYAESVCSASSTSTVRSRNVSIHSLSDIASSSGGQLDFEDFNDSSLSEPMSSEQVDPDDDDIQNYAVVITENTIEEVSRQLVLLLSKHQHLPLQHDSFHAQDNRLFSNLDQVANRVIRLLEGKAGQLDLHIKAALQDIILSFTGTSMEEGHDALITQVTDVLHEEMIHFRTRRRVLDGYSWEIKNQQELLQKTRTNLMNLKAGRVSDLAKLHRKRMARLQNKISDSQVTRNAKQAPRAPYLSDASVDAGTQSEASDFTDELTDTSSFFRHELELASCSKLISDEEDSEFSFGYDIPSGPPVPHMDSTTTDPPASHSHNLSKQIFLKALAERIIEPAVSNTKRTSVDSNDTDAIGISDLPSDLENTVPSSTPTDVCGDQDTIPNSSDHVENEHLDAESLEISGFSNSTDQVNDSTTTDCGNSIDQVNNNTTTDCGNSIDQVNNNTTTDCGNSLDQVNNNTTTDCGNSIDQVNNKTTTDSIDQVNSTDTAETCNEPYAHAKRASLLMREDSCKHDESNPLGFLQLNESKMEELHEKYLEEQSQDLLASNLPGSEMNLVGNEMDGIDPANR